MPLFSKLEAQKSKPELSDYDRKTRRDSYETNTEELAQKFDVNPGDIIREDAKIESNMREDLKIYGDQIDADLSVEYLNGGRRILRGTIGNKKVEIVAKAKIEETAEEGTLDGHYISKEEATEIYKEFAHSGKYRTNFAKNLSQDKKIGEIRDRLLADGIKEEEVEKIIHLMKDTLDPYY